MIIGIDLGTTNSLVGCYRNGRVELIPNRLGDLMTPSVVAWHENGIVVGKVAKEIIARSPSSGCSAFKRFMGTDKAYHFGEQGEGKVQILGLKRSHPHPHPHTMNAADLSALILRSLVEDAEHYLGERVTEAVISVPAYFNDKQRKATIEAAQLAGLKVERLINEPTAAAIAYQMTDKSDEIVLAIVDLGGGTFDVSILDIFDSIIEVRAVSGDNYLGGEDFDHILMDHLIKTWGISPEKRTAAVNAKLKYTAERLKQALSVKNEVTAEFEIDGVTYSCLVTENDLEKLLIVQLDRMRLPLKQAVSDSQFKMGDIDEVILVGGSTRMPLVKKYIAKAFGKLPLCHLNPDEVVAIGATMAAAMKSRNEDFSDTVLTDVCPYTLGTTFAKELPDGSYKSTYDPILERNTTVPASVVRRYYNARDNQKVVTIHAYQGESFDISNNLKLGEFTLNIPQRPQSTVPIDVRFTYDVNGILEVEATVLETGETGRQIMINANDMSTSAIETRMGELAKLKQHPRDQEENMFLVSRAERLYEMTLGHLRLQVGEELDLFLAALNTQHHDDIKRGRKRIKDFLVFVEGIR